jgi:hypothetical protein
MAMVMMVEMVMTVAIAMVLVPRQRELMAIMI